MNSLRGYPVDTPCDVCGEIDECEMEPRFLYVVCKKHADVSPHTITKKTIAGK